MNGRYIVMERNTKGRGRYGVYVRIAVVELTPGFVGTPALISERSCGVERIVRTWEQCSVGKTKRCEAAVARREAEELAARLNCPLTFFIDAVDGAL